MVVKLKDIKKELEKFKTDKDRLDYLESLLEKVEDKKLITKIKKLIEEFQSLETEIEESVEESSTDLIDLKEDESSFEIEGIEERVADLEGRVTRPEVRAERQTDYSVQRSVSYDVSSGSTINGLRYDLERKGLLHVGTHEQVMEEKVEISRYLGNVPIEIVDKYFNELERGETFKKYGSNIPSMDIYESLTEKKKKIR